MIAVALMLGLAACKNERRASELRTGSWRAVIKIQGQNLPFNFEITRDEQHGYDAYLLNADDTLLLDEVEVREDSVDIALHVFDANIKARISGDSLRGFFVKNYEENYRLPFQAAHGQDYRFLPAAQRFTPVDFTGKYDVIFRDLTDNPEHRVDTTLAVGLFHQSGDHVTGTFMTATGDYRFLEGRVVDSLMQLSTFDGNFTYLFRARMQKDGSLKGEFFSGKTLHESWVGRKNENAALPDPESLTHLKEGYDRISFTFPDVEGRKVSLGDPRYRGKVVILQLLGSWCPNCLDETRFLAPWYDKNKARGVEVIGLAYERKEDFDYASARVKKMMEKMDVHYPILIAGTNKEGSAAKSLPMLNTVMAFPTTIFIGRDGKVVSIHTGFNGPGTGEYYDAFIQYFNETVNGMLKHNSEQRTQ